MKTKINILAHLRARNKDEEKILREYFNSVKIKSKKERKKDKIAKIFKVKKQHQTLAGFDDKY